MSTLNKKVFDLFSKRVERAKTIETLNLLTWLLHVNTVLTVGQRKKLATLLVGKRKQIS